MIVSSSERPRPATATSSATELRQHHRRHHRGVSLILLLVYTLDPRYNAPQYNADSVITRLRSWTLTFQGLAKAG